jgi:hypothetical protein
MSTNDERWQILFYARSLTSPKMTSVALAPRVENNIWEPFSAT